MRFSAITKYWLFPEPRFNQGFQPALGCTWTTTRRFARPVASDSAPTRIRWSFMMEPTMWGHPSCPLNMLVDESPILGRFHHEEPTSMRIPTMLVGENVFWWVTRCRQMPGRNLWDCLVVNSLVASQHLGTTNPKSIIFNLYLFIENWSKPRNVKYLSNQTGHITRSHHPVWTYESNRVMAGQIVSPWLDNRALNINCFTCGCGSKHCTPGEHPKNYQNSQTVGMWTTTHFLDDWPWSTPAYQPYSIIDHHQPLLTN